jgi:DNA-binding response OmpR family regulator
VLVLNAGQPFSRSQLSARVYGEDHSPDQRNIDMVVSRLRKYLNQGASSREYIQTLRGVGYLFVL